MAAPTLQEILMGGFAFFIESGTVGASATAKPSMDPASNWTDASLGNIMNFQFGVEEVDLSFNKVLPSGIWVKQNRKMVVQDYVDIEAREMNELVWRLQHGVAAKIAEGTAQTPGAVSDRKVDGWLRLQGRVLGGYDRFIQDWWAECRLVAGSVADGKVSQPKLRFTQIKAVAGVMVAGDSTNFPVQA